MEKTELEKRIDSKIPGEDTGIEVRQTFCSICSPSHHCGVDAYIKDGKVIKVEGTAGHPMNDGILCTKGCGNRAFIYREDRVKTPMRRVGPRGSGEFEPISWDQAYDIIAENLLKIRQESGADSVAFYGGYQKWFRWMLSRFAYDFGSSNYGTESSACMTANRMAWNTLGGVGGKMDIKNARLYVAWAGGNHHSKHLGARNAERLHAKGMKLVVVDPRNTPLATRTADLHIAPQPGTDGLLANAVAGEIIRNGWQDQAYIDRYVHGYQEYKDYVCSLDLEEVSRITGVPTRQIRQLARMMGTIKPMSIEASPISLIHQTNGYQTVRAIFSLSVITGNYDTVGGNQPGDYSFAHMNAGFTTREDEFEHHNTPATFDDRVGARRFPLWGALVHEMQALDLRQQILRGEPYPIRGLFALGFNYRIFPDSEMFLKALNKLDFIVAADLFFTDTAKYADIVLPSCSSFEREEIKVYPGGFAKYYKPVIEPLYESKSDALILQELAIRMDLPDDLLRAGYRKCAEFAFQDNGFDLDELIASPLPLKSPNMKPYVPHAYIDGGCKTPTGKIELYSELVAEVGKEKGLDPLPRWYAPASMPTEKYPFRLLAGVRLPNMIHSTLHDVSWNRSLRPDPMADISLEDAEKLGLEYGDTIRLYNDLGSITVKANPTGLMNPGQVCMFHGYREADVNLLLNAEDLDPYSGFPGYKNGICAIEKVEGRDI